MPNELFRFDDVVIHWGRASLVRADWLMIHIIDINGCAYPQWATRKYWHSGLHNIHFHSGRYSEKSDQLKHQYVNLLAVCDFVF